MKHVFKYCFMFLGFILFSFSFMSGSSAENIREPVWAGKFYPDSKAALEEQIKDLTQKARETTFHPPAGKKVKAVIMPHAGYIYSGLTAAHASLVLKDQHFTKVILMGPDHRIGFENCAVSNASAFRTPLGLVPVHSDARTLRKNPELFTAVPESDAIEHSLEVVLPFLQTYLHSFEMVPIVAGHTNKVEELASTLEPVIDDQTLLVVSSDLSHYLSYSEAVRKDRETIDMILAKKADDLAKSRLRACGDVPIAILLNLAARHDWQPVLIHYANSGDTAGDKSRVVGYAAIAFFGNDSETSPQSNIRILTREQGTILLTLARHTLMKELGIKIKPPASASLASALKDPVFNLERGTFVTLTMDGNLRGCIGNIAVHGTIRESIRRNAVKAAFEDPRFKPLTKEEFKKVHIEVSILTEPKPLKYTAGTDLVSKLRPNIDGVIIKKNFAYATFLPQVWQQIPTPERFLSRLCQKAGLSPDAWRNDQLDVFTYQIQYFEE